MARSMQGARVLITGGASGIGRLLALRLSELNAHVIVWDLNARGAEAVRDEIQATGGSAAAAGVDVTDLDAVNEAAAAAGEVDIVINNAGVVTGKHLVDATPEQIRRTYEVNALAPYWVTKAFLPGMLARNRGLVVTVSSAAGLVGVAKQTDYSASKFAAFGFTESLRAELRTMKSKVRTLTVCPYYIDTGMFDGVQTKFPLLLPILSEQKVADKIVAAIQSGRRQLIMPPFVRVVPLVRILPPRLFDWVLDFFGINTTMDNFTGRTDR